MEVTKNFVSQLRKQLGDELHESDFGIDGDLREVLACFDRALLEVTLPGSNGEAPAPGQAKSKWYGKGKGKKSHRGPTAGSPEARDRAKRAAASRARNKAERDKQSDLPLDTPGNGGVARPGHQMGV